MSLTAAEQDTVDKAGLQRTDSTWRVGAALTSNGLNRADQSLARLRENTEMNLKRQDRAGARRP